MVSDIEYFKTWNYYENKIILIVDTDKSSWG